MSADKARTGCEPLDSKLTGGVLRGENILLMGPPLAGKRYFSRLFLYTGLQDGEAAILCCTNNTAEGEREAMAKMGLDVSKFEEEGRIAYLDFYTRILGAPLKDKANIRRLPSVMDLASFNLALREFTASFLAKELHIRLVFDSVSTLLIYNPFGMVSRFLHLVFGRLKMYKATSLFLLEEGSHSQSEVNTIVSMVDAVIRVRHDEDVNERLIRYESERVTTDWMPF